MQKKEQHIAERPIFPVKGRLVLCNIPDAGIALAKSHYTA